MMVDKMAQNFVCLLSCATYSFSYFFCYLIAVVTVAAEISELVLIAADCMLFLNEPNPISVEVSELPSHWATEQPAPRVAKSPS